MLPHCRCRSAPLPLKVDGFSMGAVMGYSEQHTALLLSSDDDIQGFLKVGSGNCAQSLSMGTLHMFGATQHDG